MALPALADEPPDDGSTAPLHGAPSDWRGDDAAVDHRFTVPSAQTLRAGDVALNSYELIVGLGVSVGITDWLEASLSAGPLLGVAGGVVSVKGRPVATDYVTVAVQVAGAFAVDEVAVAGFALVDVHRADGLLSFSLAAGVLGSFDDCCGDGWNEDEDSPYLLVSAGPTLRASKHVALMVEVEGAFSLGEMRSSTPIAQGPLLITYGMRFHNPTVALDLALVRPLEGGWDDDWPLGFPYAGISVRF